jgi:TP901 family phage tail tape measure protein
VDAYTKVGSQRPELLKNKEALASVTQAAIILSEAAKSKLEPATLALTTTMNQFNLGAGQTNRIINTLAAGSKVGAGEIPYLTEVLEKSGTTANLMGISIEEMTGIIEGVAPKFAIARIAGTSLDRVLLKMRDKGIGVKDGLFDMNRAIDELSARYKKGQSAADLFGVEHSKMGEVLVQNRDQINQFTAAVTGTSVAFEQAGKNTDNNAARLAQAKNRVTLMYIEIGQKLAPMMTFSTNAFNIFLKVLLKLPEIISKNRVLLVSLAGAILAYNGALIQSIALSAWDRASKLLSIKSTSLQILMTEAQATQTARLNVIQKAAVVTQWLLNAAQAANPVGLVIAGITALVGAMMIYSRNSRSALEMETRKQELLGEITSANGELSVSYDMLSEDQAKLSRMSKEQRQNLSDELDSTIKLAEANLELQKAKRTDIKTDNTKLNAWQFLTTWSNSGKLEKARKNGLKAVEDIDEALGKSGDLIQSLKDNKITLSDILSAEAVGDKIGTESIVNLEEKLDRYSTALRYAKFGTEEYLRLKEKVRKADADLKKMRGSDLDGSGEDEKFKRAEALKDIEEFHRKQTAVLKKSYAEGKTDKDQYLEAMDQEEIRYLNASIVRLKKHGQDTSEEENKIQDTVITAREAGTKKTEEATKELYKQYDDFYEKWDEESKKFLKDAGENTKLPDWYVQQQLELDYWMESTYEGQKAKFRKELDDKVIGYTEYTAKILALDKEAAEKQFQHMEDWARGSNTIIDAVSTMYEAAKNRELAVAGLTDKQKAAIEKKYAKRQQDIAIAQTIIEGVMEVARVNSNAGVNADLTQSLRAFLTAAAIIRTGANVALIKSQQFAGGKYPVVGKDDGRTYQAAFMGGIRTGYYSKPTLGLFAEREPEIVIDGPTTRNIKANFPQILSAIQAARVPQYAGGLYPELGTGQQAFPAELKDLLIANYRMMQEVRDAHKRPAMVSFQSIRDKQDEFNALKSKTTIG